MMKRCLHVVVVLLALGTWAADVKASDVAPDEGDAVVFAPPGPINLGKGKDPFNFTATFPVSIVAGDNVGGVTHLRFNLTESDFFVDDQMICVDQPLAAFQPVGTKIAVTFAFQLACQPDNDLTSIFISVAAVGPGGPIANGAPLVLSGGKAFVESGDPPYDVVIEDVIAAGPPCITGGDNLGLLEVDCVVNVDGPGLTDLGIILLTLLLLGIGSWYIVRRRHELA